MPTYQYRCVDCGSELEIVQKFSDASLTECPECEGSLRKVYSAVGVVFKGSGFYATDNRTKGKAAAGGGSSEKPSGTEKSSGSEKSSGTEKSSGSEKSSSSEKSASTSGSGSSSKPASSSTTSAA